MIQWRRNVMLRYWVTIQEQAPVSCQSFHLQRLFFLRVAWPVSQQCLFLPLPCCCFLMTSVLTKACFCILAKYFTSSAAFLTTCNKDISKYLLLDLSRKYCNSWVRMRWFFLSLKRNQRVLYEAVFKYRSYLHSLISAK